MNKRNGIDMGLQLLKTESDARYKVYFNGQHLGYFYLEADGFYVFTPKGDIGYWNEFSLRMIADKLEELNRQQNEAITLYFKENNNLTIPPLRYLLQTNIHIYSEYAYKQYDEDFDSEYPPFSAPYPKRLTLKEFEVKILSDDEFNKRYGDVSLAKQLKLK